MSSINVGRGPGSGGNENHDGDPTNKTLGEKVGQERPAGNEVLDEAAPDLPAGVPGGRANADAPQEAAKPWPDGPNVETSPWEVDAARGKLPRP